MLSVHAQTRANGYIDTAFTATCLTGPSSNVTSALLVLGDGKIMAGGNYLFTGAGCGNAVHRLRTNGAPDTAFNASRPTGDFVNALAMQSNGKVLIGGRLTDGSSAFPVARLNSGGANDSGFQHYLAQPLVAYALAVQPDDKVIVGGSANAAGGFVIRLNANGALDGSFTNAVVTEANASALIRAVAWQSFPSVKILVGGSFASYSDTRVTSNRSGLARLNDDGTLDKTFRAPLTNAEVRALLVQPDGKILVAGRFQSHGGEDRCLARLNDDGTRDSTFTPVGTGITALSLALEPDGKILVGHDLGVMRVTTNGVVDATFGPRNADGAFGTRAVFASAVTKSFDGNVLVGATSVIVNNTERRGVARLFGNFPPAPVIVAFSTNRTVDAGTNITFSVMATGAPPISFQWFKNGQKINGETRTNLAFVDVESTDIGNYTVVASNEGGSVTSVVARLTVNFNLSSITVTIAPVQGGAVSPNFKNLALEIGREYTLTARPAKGFLFTNWSGFETSANPVLIFTMQSNEVLQANFVPSPFIPVRGVYTGLFYDTNAPAHENAGGFLLTLDDKGGFKGTVTTGKSKRKFRGVFSLQRVATVNIPETPTLPPLALALELDTQNGTMGGTVTMGANAPSTLAAFRNGFSARLNPAPTAGLYNAALPSTNDPALAPPGDGILPLTVSTAGRVSGKGVLADGTAWSLVSATSADAWVPVYVALYSGAGSIFGWLSVTNTGANDVAGTLWWEKPGGLKGTIHPAGITNRMDTVGSRFVAVVKGTPVLNLPNGVAILSGGNLTDAITNLISLGGDNKITGANGLVLTFSTTKGTMTGSFIDPATLKKRAVKGVVLPNQNQARGFFLGVDEGGGVYVGG